MLVGGRTWWIKQDVSRAFEERGYHLLPRHFYSPVPDPDTIAGHKWDAESFPLSKLRFDDAETMRLCGTLVEHAREIEPLPSTAAQAQGGYHWDNVFFTGLDAVALYGLVRDLKPKRIVEIGSGYSTHLSVRAVRVNGAGRVTCIEPYPTALLELRDEVDLLETTVQQAPAKSSSHSDTTTSCSSTRATCPRWGATSTSSCCSSCRLLVKAHSSTCTTSFFPTTTRSSSWTSDAGTGTSSTCSMPSCSSTLPSR